MQYMKILIKPVCNVMARAYPCSFSSKLIYEIKYDAPIRGHHVYKQTWTPQKFYTARKAFYTARKKRWI